MNKALFLDRDGIVNCPIKRKSKFYGKIIDDSPFQVSELKFVKGIKKLIEAARQQNYKIIIVTNQPSFLKENRFLKDYEEITSKICKILSLERSQVFECFHKEGFSLPCECRKPKPGLFYFAKGMHNIDLDNSIMLGDSFSDIKAAKSARVGLTIYLKRKYNEEQIGNLEDEKKMKSKGPIADYIFKNLSEVIHLLKSL